MAHRKVLPVNGCDDICMESIHQPGLPHQAEQGFLISRRTPTRNRHTKGTPSDNHHIQNVPGYKHEPSLAPVPSVTSNLGENWQNKIYTVQVYTRTTWQSQFQSVPFYPIDLPIVVDMT